MADISSVTLPAAGDQGELRRFRNDFYDCLSAWPDALFELLDAVCNPVAVAGIAHLSLAATARRGHGSAYAAIAKGDLDPDQIRDLLAVARPSGWAPTFAIDATTWARCDAECSPGRGFYYHPSRHSAGKPIVAGWCYSWLVGLSQAPDSWTAPWEARRTVVGENLNTVAVQQIRLFLPHLGSTPGSTGVPALFAFDGGYDPVQLSVGLHGLDAQTPKIRTPEQADRWTWLILAALTRLRLARQHVADHRLPWQPPQPTTKMT